MPGFAGLTKGVFGAILSQVDGDTTRPKWPCHPSPRVVDTALVLAFSSWCTLASASYVGSPRTGVNPGCWKYVFLKFVVEVDIVHC